MLRSATLSARARQLTPQATERELAKTVTSAISAAILVALFAVAGPASAATTAGGGLTVPGVPKITDIVCVSGCSKIRTSSPGGTVQVSGSGMNRVSVVNFPGDQGRVKTQPASTTSTSLLVEVPKGATTGRLRVISSTGSTSSPSKTILEIGKAPAAQNSPLTISDASTTPSIAYQYGAKKPKLNFVVTGGRAKNDLRIDIVDSSGSVVASRTRRGVERGSSQRVTWNGKSGRRQAGNGKYRFVVRSVDGTAATLSRKLTRARAKASRTRSSDPLGFKLFGYVFPVRASHYYGDGIGAGRNHQGIDVMAKCGTPLIAARGGTVYYNDYQAGGAGNYLVINLAGTKNQSHVYMHLTKRSRFKVGSRIKTGQRIGFVGTTGRSSACHLHFEHWSAPGWYQGGTFLDPTGPIKRWDRYS